MITLPIMLREAMSKFGNSAVDKWWSELDLLARVDVIELWQSVAFTQPCVARAGARFVDEEEEGSRSNLWHDDFYEYLVNHEVYLVDAPGPHICTQHPAAKAAVAAGRIPGIFACPLDRAECPMRQLLQVAPGKSVELGLVFMPADQAAKLQSR